MTLVRLRLPQECGPSSAVSPTLEEALERQGEETI